MTHSKQMEREYLQRYRDGDESAFLDFYRSMESNLYMYLTLQTGKSDLALEAMQECFRQLIRNLDLVIRAEDVRRYVFGMARNIVTQDRRTLGKNRDMVEKIQADKSAAALIMLPRDASDPAATAERADSLSKALSALTPELQEVVVLRFYEGFSFQEIAELTGTPLRTLYSRYHSALDKMKEEMK